LRSQPRVPHPTRAQHRKRKALRRARHLSPSQSPHNLLGPT
jgi:hypothetical protein